MRISDWSSDVCSSDLFRRSTQAAEEVQAVLVDDADAEALQIGDRVDRVLGIDGLPRPGHDVDDLLVALLRVLLVDRPLYLRQLLDLVIAGPAVRHGFDAENPARGPVGEDGGP